MPIREKFSLTIITLYFAGIIVSDMLNVYPAYFKDQMAFFGVLWIIGVCGTVLHFVWRKWE